MFKIEESVLKKLVKFGGASDISNIASKDELPEKYEQIAYSIDKVFGLSGRLFKGTSGKLYAIVGHASALYKI